MDDIKRNSLWYFLGVLVVLLLMQEWLDPRHTETLAYSDFKQAVQEGRIREVTLSDGIASGILDRPDAASPVPGQAASSGAPAGKAVEHRFVTTLVNDPGLVAQMDEAKVRYRAVTQSKWLAAVLSWVLPTAIFVGIWMFAMKRMGGGGDRQPQPAGVRVP